MSESPEQQEQTDKKAAEQFTRQVIKHISNATDVQKLILLKELLKRPPEFPSPAEHALIVFKGLNEKEIMKVLTVAQRQFDKDTWEFMARWR